jgi:predicted RNA binding protein YcfA (HicA-like mRNA interferase family)
MSRMPQVNACALIAFLKRRGFVEDRQVGSHLTLWNEARHVAVTIPVHGGDLGRGLAVRILKDSGFSVDDFLAE